MIFDLNYFEQVVDELTLKKGLRLFQKSTVLLNEKLDRYTFEFIVNSFEVIVKKKADYLLDYKCGCSKAKPCEHICAILFYFQQDILDLKSKNQNFKKSKSAAIKVPADYERCLITIQKQIYPYLIKETLRTTQIQKLWNNLNQFVFTNNFDNTNQFFKYLALVNEFYSLYKVRFIDSETMLFDLFYKSKVQLQNRCKTKLQKEELLALEIAALQSIKNNSILISEVFCFLIPMLISQSRNKLLFDKLFVLVSKRKFNQNYADKFNKLHIVQFQIAVKANELFGQKLNFKNETIEFTLAQAENLFYSNKVKKAFDYLEIKRLVIKNKYHQLYVPYLDFVIDKAREENNHNVELNYLEERFIYSPFYSAQQFARLLQLIPKTQQQLFFDNLISKIKLLFKHNYFEKIIPFLIHQKRWNELLQELKHQSQKFPLVHEVAINLLPICSETIVNLYLKHFIETVTGTKPYPYQQKLVGLAKNYFDKLPNEISKKAIEKVMFGIGKNLPIYRYAELELIPI